MASLRRRSGCLGTVPGYSFQSLNNKGRYVGNKA